MNLKALYALGYGLYVVCSKKDDKLNGQIANTVFQVCAEPPIIAVALNKQNLTNEFVSTSKVFTVSILSQDTPLSFIGGFGFRSGRDVDKLKGISYKLGETGAPIVLDNTLAYLEAKMINQVAYYHQVKRGSTPKTAPVYIEEKKEAAPKMAKYKCTICGYVYDPELGDPDGGIKPGTAFEKIPDDWVCPVCGASKDQFEKVEG